MSLRQRKIKLLQQEQRKLKGLPIRKMQTEKGISRVKRVTTKSLMRQPEKGKIMLEYPKVSLRKQKTSKIQEKTRALKKPPAKKLNKRMFYY